jgi:hypothetical protein
MGKMMVEFWLTTISPIVWKSLSCRTVELSQYVGESLHRHGRRVPCDPGYHTYRREPLGVLRGEQPEELSLIRVAQLYTQETSSRKCVNFTSRRMTTA